MAEACGQILHELVRGACVAVPYHPGNDQFRISIHGHPGPDAPDAELALPSSGMFLSLAYRGPDFVALDALAVKVPKGLVLVLGACRTADSSNRATVFLPTPNMR